MKAYNLHGLTASLLVLTALSFAPLKAQSTTFNNDDANSSWSDSGNWSNTSPVTIGSTAVVFIGTQPFNNQIGVDTGTNPNIISSLTFNNTLTGDMSIIPGFGNEELTVGGATAVPNDGSIINLSAHNISIELPVIAGDNGIYAGGPTGGSLNFTSTLDLGTFNIATTGVVSMSDNVFDTGSITVGSGATTGTLTMTGDNTYTGGTVVSGGAAIAGESNIGTTSGAFGPSAEAVTLGNANTTTNNLSASILINGGGITVSNPIIVANDATTGTYTIGGTNTGLTATYTGNITLNQAVSLVAATGGTVDFNTGTWTTNNKAITIGSTGNAGTVELDGTVATSGGITIDFGTLALGATGNLTSATGVDLANSGTTFDISAGSQTIGDLSGVAGSTVNLGTSGLTTGTSASTEFDGVIQGTGGTLIKVGTGALVLTGTNTFSGGTTITAGTLQLGNGGATGSLGGGNIIDDGSLVSDRSGVITPSSIVSGTGTVTQEGPGTLALNVANTFTGGSTISTGTVTVGISNVGSTSGALGATNGTTDVATLGNASTTTNNSSPTLLISGAFTLSNPITVANDATTGTYTIGGSNTTGTATYTGNIVLNQAVTLQAATGGTVDFTTGTWTTGNNAITIGSTGNTGTVELNHALTTSGGIAVDFGTLALDAALTGNTTVASGATLSGTGSVSGTTGVTSGTINGSGLTLTGATTFNSTGNVLSGSENANVTVATGATLANSATVTGGATIDGTLTGTGGSFSGASTLSGGTINLTSGSFGSTLGVTGTSAWNGAGSVTGAVNETSGTFTIGSGANLTANGGLNVTGGSIASGSGTSTITGNVDYTSGTGSTFGGVIAGVGKTLTMNSGGVTLTLSGVNNYTGATAVDAGTLNVTGSTAVGSTVTVGNNTGVATLEGTGTINGSLTTSSTGGNVAIISPGTTGTAGTLTIGGTNLTLGNGTNLDFDLATTTTVGSGVNDLISMTGTGATLTLGTNGTLTINYNMLGVSLATGTAYTLISGATTVDNFNASNITSNNLGSLTAAYSVSGGALEVTFTSAAATTYFYSGATSNDFTLAANFNTDATSDVQQTVGPSASSNVFIGTTTPATTLTPTLGANNLTINTLTFEPSGSGATLSGTGTLTIDAGVTVSTGATDIESISAPVALGASQTWTVNGTSTLADSGGISGAFALTKAGTGTLALSGADTYTGATTISAGALNIQSNSALGTGAGTSTSGVTVALTGAALQIQGGISTTTAVALTLNGTGLAGNGALENVSGTNTYSGLITLGSNATIGSDAGTLNLTNTGTITGSGFDLTLTGAGNGTIHSIIGTGAGTLTMTGSGTWTLFGANTFTGNTSVTSGTLDLSNSLALENSTVTSGGTGIVFDSSVGSDAFTFGGLSGSANLALQNNAGTPAAVALTVGGNNSSTTYSGDLSAAGSLIKAGTGTLTLSGTNGYTGATTVSDGTLQIGNGSAGLISDSSAVSVALGATLAFDEATGLTQSNAIADSGTVEGAEGSGITNTLSGAITGSGVFTQTGTGTTVLTNTGNTYASTTITAGTLQIGDGATGNGSLGSGSVTDDAALVFDPLTASIIANAITGSGTVTKKGSSATILTNTGNTYSGGTTITAGILQIGNGTTSNGSIGTAGVLDDASLVFDPFSTSTIANAITGSGAVTQNGPGTTILTSSSNAYLGTTTVANGTLQIGNGATGLISNTSPVSVSLGATLAFDEANNLAQSNSIDDAGTVEGAEGSGITNTLSGAITDTGVFTQTGAGTTILTNTGNTYSGGTTITAGTLQIGDGVTSNGSVGTIGVTDNAALVFDPMASSTSTIANAITGSGTVTQNGPGTTVLTSSSNNYSGNTTVSAGTLQIGDGSSGAINNSSIVSVSSGATLAFDEATGSTQINAITDSGTVAGVEGGGIVNTLSGNITGGGVFTQTGTGTTVLSGDNGYSGGTTISAGTLKTGSANALGATTNSLTDNATLDLDGNSVTVGALNGSGTVTNNGGSDSTLSVSGGGDFTGGIEDGTTNTTALTLSGGTLVLSGASSYSGGTTISTGSTLEVESATALGAGAVVNNGTLEAGGGQHVINVATDYTQNAGGTLDITLRSDPVVSGTNDLLSVGGTATLNGNLDIIIVPSGAFTPTKGDSFTVVEANTASPSTPDGITTAGAGFTTAIESAPGLVFTGAVANSNNDLIVTILSTQLALTSIPGVVYTPNQAAVANYISEFITSGPLFNALANIVTNNPQDLPGIQDQLSPEKFGNFAISTVINNAAFSTQMLDSYFESQRSSNGDFGASNGQIDSSGLTVVDPSMDPGLAQVSSRLLAWSPAPLSHGLLSDSSDPVTAGIDMKDMKPTTAPDKGYDYDVFVMGNAVLAQDFSQADVPHADTTTGAVQIGADYRITPHLRVGAIFGYGHTDADLDDIGSKATVDSYAPGAFISYAQNGWYLNALGSYGFDNFTEDRSVSFPGFSGIAHGAPNGDQIVGNLDGGYDFHEKNWTFGPLVGVQYTHMDVDSYTEGGANPVDLQVDKMETDSLRSRLGGHVSYVFHTGKVLLTPHLDASWQHEFMDQSRGITSQFTSVGVGSFTINTPQPSRDSALIDGGLSADLNGQVSLYLDYLVQAGQSNYFGQAVEAGVKVGF